MFVIELNQGDIQFNALADTGVRKPLGNAIVIKGIPKVLFDLRQVVLLLVLWMCASNSERLRVGFDVLVNKDISLLVEYADIQSAGMQINTAVMLMCLGVEFHVRSPPSL